MKKLAYGVAGLIILLVGAALVVPSVIDWNAYKPEISAEVQKATGRTLEIAGDLEFSVLPSPRLRVANVQLSNTPGATAKHMLALKGLKVSVKLVPLLQGNIEVASVTLIEPLIELEKLADGKANWTFTPAGGATPVSQAPSSSSSSRGDRKGSSGAAFKLDRLSIENGTVVYRDKLTGSVERIENLRAVMSAGSLAGPFSFEGGLTARNIPLTLSARVNKFAEKGAVPFRASIGTPGAPRAIGLTGTVTDIETKPVVAAKLDGKGDDLGLLVAAFSGGAAPAQLAQAFSVSAKIEGSGTSVKINDLALQLGGSTATGNIGVALQDGVKADIALRIKSLDADALMAASSGAAQAPALPARQNGEKASGSDPVAPAPARKFEIPADIEANVGLSIDEVIAKKGRIRDVGLSASLKGGAVTLNTLEAGLPGGSQVSASGTMSTPKGALSYGGKLTFRSSSLRTLLEWLEVDISAVPADRLRRFNATADISGTPSEIQIANIASQLDASRMSGGVTIALRDRTAFGASISIDQLNADAYLGTGGPAATGGKPASGNAATPAPSPATQQNAAQGPLAILNEFDANLALRIGSLSYRQTTIQGVRLDGTLVNGVMTLRDASVQSLAGTSAQIKGTLTGLDGIPAFKGTVAAASDDLTGLFRVAGISSSIPPRKLGKLRLTSRTDVSGGALKIDASFQIAEIRAKIVGSATGLPAAPAFDLRLDAQHPEFARLANLAGDGKPGPPVGRVGFRLDVKGDEKLVTLDADSTIAGGEFRVAGSIRTPLGIPELDIGIDLKHPDFVSFARAFDAGFRPANPKLGGLQLAAKLTGTDQKLSIADLIGTIGPTKISGAGSYAAGAVRPKVILELVSSIIPLSDFLEAPRRGAAQAARPTAGPTGAPVRPAATESQRWSAEPIDTAVFGLVDASIDLRAKAVLYKTFRVDQPKIIAVMKDKVLNIERVSGTMFDGGFQMRGTVDGRDVPVASTSLTITKANIGKALFQAAEFDIATGVLSFEMDLSARGKSQADMIRALNGKGRLNVVDGVVKGFDLKQVSDNLKNLNQLTGLLGVLGSAMGGGSTRFSSLAGTFGIDRGIMRTDDLKLAADAGAGDARGFVDLPNWNMDMVADFRLTDHPTAPPFRVRAVGPPDDPRRLFDFQALQAWVLQQGVGSLIKNLVPGNKDASGNQQQQQQVKPEDILKGLLKGLGR